MHLPYFSLRDYFFKKYGKRVQKITVSLPFTCPNRDGSKSKGGCSFCYDGSKPLRIDSGKDLKIQIKEGIEKAKRKYGEDILFIIYYQSYTNTYGSLDYLKEVYNTALQFERVVGIDIGTRPDCMPEEVISLLVDYCKKGLEVWVELGLQSANFETLKKINRAHGVSDFIEAVLRIAPTPLKICTHIIVGLPGEDKRDFLETAKLVASLPVEGIKIHPLHIVKHTPLARVYQKNPFPLLDFEEYVKICADIIEILPPKVVIQRITGEIEEDLLIAPYYCSPKYKNKVIKAVEEELKFRGTRQGSKASRSYLLNKAINS